MDLVNYLPLDFGQYSPEEISACLKTSNLEHNWQHWLLSNQDILGLAAKNWLFDYSSIGLGLKSKSRLKERPIFIGQKDSKNSLLALVQKMSEGLGAIQFIDATAGLLNDTYSLMRLGFPLTSYESNPLLVLLIMANSLLKTNFKELKTQWEFKPKSFSLEELTILAKNKQTVVLYDPMFQVKHHKSLPSLEMQILHELETEFSNLALTAQEFLQWQEIAKTIIVKRPDKAPYLLDIAPKYSINSKLLRWDFY